jgi:exonuclease III
MKIISLNTWGGRAGKEVLLSFFKKHADVDIFCLQEIWAAPHKNYEGVLAGGINLENEKVMTEGMQDISAILSGHDSYFRPHLFDHYGLQLLVKKDLKVIKEGELFVYKEKGHIPKDDLGNHARNIQYVTIERNNGLWNGKGKGDSDDRIQQTKNILEFTSTLSHDFVLCGDFNLLPDTKSIKLFEDTGLKNLIKEYGITSTRTSLYTKPVPYADYIFTTPGIEVKDFKVLLEEVSDHAALYLEI